MVHENSLSNVNVTRNDSPRKATPIRSKKSKSVEQTESPDLLNAEESEGSDLSGRGSKRKRTKREVIDLGIFVSQFIFKVLSQHPTSAKK